MGSCLGKERRSKYEAPIENQHDENDKLINNINHKHGQKNGRETDTKINKSNEGNDKKETAMGESRSNYEHQDEMITKKNVVKNKGLQKYAEEMAQKIVGCVKAEFEDRASKPLTPAIT